MLFSFGNFHLDDRRLELRRENAVVRVEERVLEVLVYLVHHRDRVVSRDELLQEVWGGEEVSDTSLSRAISLLRRALRDASHRPRFIETVYGRGYRFAEDVDVQIARAESGQAPNPTAARRARVDRKTTKPPVPTARNELERCRQLLAHGEREARAAELTSARRTLLRAFKAARKLRDGELLARAALAYAAATPLAPVEWGAATADLLREALAAQPPGRSRFRALLEVRLVATSVQSVPLDERVRRCDAAIAMARRLGDARTLARTLSIAAAAGHAPERLDECMALASEAVELAEPRGDGEALLQAYHSRMMASAALGDLVGFDGDREAYHEVARERDDALAMLLAQLKLVMRGGHVGRLAGVDDMLRECARGSWDDVLVAYVFSALAGLVRERPRTGMSVTVMYDFAVTYPYIRAMLASTLCDQGMKGAAQAHYEAVAEQGFDRLPRDIGTLGTLAYLAEVCVVLDDVRGASDLYARLAPFEECFVAVAGIAFRGPVHLWLGVLASHLGRWSQARSHFEAALDATERLRIPAIGAEVACAYGEMLLRDPARASAADAERRLGEALRTARRFSLERLRARSEHLLQHARTAPGSPPPVRGLKLT